MSRSRTIRRSLESVRREARRWLKALRNDDHEAHERLRRAVPNVQSPPTLRDVQHALALESGFDGWSGLTRSIAQNVAAARAAGISALSRYEEMADALLDAYRTGTAEAMERHYRHTWHRRPWTGMRTYVQLDLGRRSSRPNDDLDISLDDARYLIAREHGFADWGELESFTQTPAVAARVAAKPVRVRHGETFPGRSNATSRSWDEVIALLGSSPATALDAEGQMTDEVLADVCRVGRVAELNLSGSTAVTDRGIRHLAKLPGLRHLNLSGTSVSDHGLLVLRHLPELRSVSLAWTRVTDAGAKELRHCDLLEKVDLAGTGASDASLRALAGKNRLSDLAITLTDAGIPSLHDLPVFKRWAGGEAEFALLGARSLPNRLSLRGPITDQGLSQLRGLDGLYGLDIDEASLAISASGIKALVVLPHLGYLGVDAKDDWMPHVAAMPRLRFLSAQDTTAGDDGFAALSRSRSIEYIWGRRCHRLRNRGFEALAKMPSLRGLAVSCLNVDDVSALPAFPALRELMPMDIPDAGFRHIGRCEQLEALILMYCRETTDAATEHIADLRHLSYYFNSYTTITDHTPELLSKLESLERVTFDTCHALTDAGIAHLARLPRLRELRVSGKHISAGVAALFAPGVTVVGS